MKEAWGFMRKNRMAWPGDATPRRDRRVGTLFFNFHTLRGLVEKEKKNTNIGANIISAASPVSRSCLVRHALSWGEGIFFNPSAPGPYMQMQPLLAFFPCENREPVTAVYLPPRRADLNTGRLSRIVLNFKLKLWISSDRVCIPNHYNNVHDW